jgi:hypothetical protein
MLNKLNRERVFSAQGLGYFATTANLALVPVHSAVSCDSSVMLAQVSLVILLLNAILTFRTPRGTFCRFQPLVWGVFATLANVFAVH